MSRDFNKVILMGRLARDPDVRYTPSKVKVVRFTLCTGRQWKNKATGELQSHTDFVPVTTWNFTADIVERYVKKGSQIMVEGRISTRDYDDVKTGVHRWVTEVIADNIILLGSPIRRSDEQYGASFQQPYGDRQSSGAFQPPYGKQSYPAQSDGMIGGQDMGSLRDEPEFQDDFPIDFADIGQSGENMQGEPDIPF